MSDYLANHTIEQLNHLVERYTENITAFRRAGLSAASIGDQEAGRERVLIALHGQALVEHAERGHTRPLATWSDAMLRDELRSIAHALRVDDGEHYDSLMRQDRIVRNEITFRGAMSSF